MPWPLGTYDSGLLLLAAGHVRSKTKNTTLATLAMVMEMMIDTPEMEYSEEAHDTKYNQITRNEVKQHAERDDTIT
jgi:hypothetical protein